MGDILGEILATKRKEVEAARAQWPNPATRFNSGKPVRSRSFRKVLTDGLPGVPRLIAEIKRKSPSAGVIRADFDPVRIAGQYVAGGASALSVLTDEPYFGGRLEYIAAVRDVVDLPVLRKDFIIDPYQVDESRAAGADAILLIGEALEAGTLLQLARQGLQMGLGVLIEVHELSTLLAILEGLDMGMREGVLVGINNRDLKRQVTDLGTFERLAPYVPRDMPLVAESGIGAAADVARVVRAGACAVLVGEALLREPDPGQAARRLLDIGRD